MQNERPSRDTFTRTNMQPNDNIDEWVEILRYSGLTPDELYRLAKNKVHSKVFEAIEMLSRLIVDKNMQIRLMEKENAKINLQNDRFYKLNTILAEQNKQYKKKLDKYNAMYLKIDDDIEVN
jgi:hypothetical protein